MGFARFIAKFIRFRRVKVYMSIQTKFISVATLCFAIGFLLVVLMVELQSRIIMYIFYISGFITAWIFFSIKCPNCGKSVMYQGKVMGVPWYAAFCQKNCVNCGHDLTVSSPK